MSATLRRELGGVAAAGVETETGADPSSADKPPASAADAPKARLTASQMLRRLLSRDQNRLRLQDPLVVPIGGELVLKVIASLIARSDSNETFSYPGGGVVRAVALRKGWGGAEVQVGALINALQRAELIEMVDGRVSLPLPPSADPVCGSQPGGFEPFKNSPGTRKGWMTPEQWDDYRRQHREGYAAQKVGDIDRARAAWERMKAMRPGMQRSLLLTVPGGVSDERGDIVGHIAPAADIDLDIANDIRGQAFRDEALVATDIGGSQAAAAASASLDIEILNPAAASSQQAAREISETAIFEPISEPISAIDIPEADILASEMVRLFGMDASAAAGAPAAIRSWQIMGADPALIRTLFQAKLEDHRAFKAAGKSGVRSPGYFKDAIREAIEHRRLLDLPISGVGGCPQPPTAAADADEGVLPDPDCPPDIQTDWMHVRRRLREEVGASEYRNWLRKMSLLGIDDDILRIQLPTRFVCDHVRTQFGARILSAWRDQVGAVTDAIFSVAMAPARGSG